MNKLILFTYRIFIQYFLQYAATMKQIIVHPAQVGTILQGARKSKRISQAELARMLDASQPAVSRLELHPENIKLADLFKMVHHYGLELWISERPKHGEQAPGVSSSNMETW